MPSGAALFTTAQTNAILRTPAAGNFFELIRVAIYCSNANTVNVGAEIGFGNLSIVADKSVTGHPGIAPGSGFVEIAPKGVRLGRGAVNEPLTFKCDVPTTGSVRVNYSYEEYPG